MQYIGGIAKEANRITWSYKSPMPRYHTCKAIRLWHSYRL